MCCAARRPERGAGVFGRSKSDPSLVAGRVCEDASDVSSEKAVRVARCLLGRVFSRVWEGGSARRASLQGSLCLGGAECVPRAIARAMCGLKFAPQDLAASTISECTVADGATCVAARARVSRCATASRPPAAAHPCTFVRGASVHAWEAAQSTPRDHSLTSSSASLIS